MVSRVEQRTKTRPRGLMDAHARAHSHTGERFLCFCYGSNGIEQIRQRCKNAELQSEAALLRGWCRVFAGSSKRWGGGGVASIIPSEGDAVHGSVVKLSMEELEMLDVFEGCDSSNPSSKDNGNVYYRDEVSVEVGQGDTVSTTPAIAYIKTNREWRGKSSIEYRRACLKNISQYWHGEAGRTRP